MATDEVPIKCGACGLSVFGKVIAKYQPDPGYANEVTFLRCPNCSSGSVKAANGSVYPSSPAGAAVKHLPDDVEHAWQEARTSFAVAAYTASEIMCRKILMHVAVDVAGAQPGKQFWEYVNALDLAGYILPGWKPTVDKIRDRGNTANHELPPSTEADALQTLGITEFLLKGTYEIAGPQQPVAQP